MAVIRNEASDLVRLRLVDYPSIEVTGRTMWHAIEIIRDRVELVDVDGEVCISIVGVF
jgi:hypothetical protein